MSGGAGAGVARVRTLLTEHRRLPGIARLLGARVLAVAPGRVAVRFGVKDEFRHPGGAVQGGILTAYADVCMALAAHTLFDAGQVLATSSLTVNFLAPVVEGPVIGEGAVVKRGRSVVFLEAVLKDGRGQQYVHATSVGSIRPAE